jgi:AraC-like DNA-binding protein
MFAEKIEFSSKQPFRIKVQKINRYPIHWHEGVTEIILPIRGNVEVVANFERLTVKEGDFHFVNNRSVHSISSASNAVVVLIYVNLPFYEKQFEFINYMFFRSNPFIDDKRQTGRQLTDNRDGDKTRFRNLLIDILLRKNSYDLQAQTLEDLANRLVYSMIFEFNWLTFYKSNERIMSSSYMDRYHRIVKFIDDHYSEKITLDDIVASEYITKTYFSHFWKKLSTYSFTERVNYERVLKSEFLLLSGMNILKISEQCGFSDVKYYYQNFKRWYGCLPKEHRQRCLDYKRLGADFDELELIYFNSELEDYANQYLFIECNFIDGMTESSYINNYMKMKLLSNPASPVTYAMKYITLNPFQPNHFITGDSGGMSFNWHAIDLSVNISADTGFPLTVSINIDSIDHELLGAAIDHFLQGCLDRYGLHLMNKWRYQINYKNIQSFDKTISIETLISMRVKNPAIVHNFEF